MRFEQNKNLKIYYGGFLDLNLEMMMMIFVWHRASTQASLVRMQLKASYRGWLQRSHSSLWSSVNAHLSDKFNLSRS